MKITAYQNNKRPGSTKLPPNGVDINDVKLKDSVDIMSPVFLLSFDITSYNYLYVPAFHRYYWINNISYDGRLYTITCACDVLASFRSDILNSNQYVLRAQSEYDSSIIDTLYPQKTGNKILSTNKNFFQKASGGTYILGIIGKAQSGGSVSGSAQYIMISSSELAKLMNYLFEPDNFTDEIVSDAVKTFFNPFQYIIDCMYFPFTWSTYGDELTLGWFTPSVDGSPITCNYISQLSWTGGSIDMEIPRPISDINDFRNYSPYASYRIYIPFFGWTNLDSNLLKGNSALELFFCLDFPTGTMMCKVIGKQTAEIITTMETQCAAKIPLAQVSYSQSIMGIAGGVIDTLSGGVGSALSALGFNSIGETISGIGDAAGMIGQQVSTKGSMGCISQDDFEWRVILQCSYFESVDFDVSDFGKPLCKIKKLSDLSGYCKTLDSHISITNATSNEMQEIETLLNGGVYLE